MTMIWPVSSTLSMVVSHIITKYVKFPQGLLIGWGACLERKTLNFLERCFMHLLLKFACISLFKQIKKVKIWNKTKYLQGKSGITEHNVLPHQLATCSHKLSEDFFSSSWQESVHFLISNFGNTSIVVS